MKLISSNIIRRVGNQGNREGKEPIHDEYTRIE